MLFQPDPLEGAPWAFIALMGVTGSGKSSFIRTITANEEIVVGHGYQSCTSDLAAYSCHLDGYNINLIDTPGFNDTWRSDTEILQSLATWFEQQYRSEEGQCLNGIVYLHDITETRMKGSALLNLRMFRQLCGKKPLQNVVLATSFWNKVDSEDGERREVELRETEEFWAGMIAGGSRMVRYTDRQSGLELLASLLRKQPMPLRIQTELVDEHKSLIDTAAGQTVNAEIARLQKKHRDEMELVKRDMEAAIRERDEETQRLLSLQKNQLEKQIDRLRSQQEQLRADRRAEQRRRQEDFFDRLEGLTEENKKLKLRLDEQQMQLLSFEEGVARVRANEAKLRAEDREFLEAKIAELSKQPEITGSEDGKPKKKRKGTSRFLFGALKAALPITTSILIGIPIHWPSIAGGDSTSQ